jgi:hypothetical protein
MSLTLVVVLQIDMPRAFRHVVPFEIQVYNLLYLLYQPARAQILWHLYQVYTKELLPLLSQLIYDLLVDVREKKYNCLF